MYNLIAIRANSTWGDSQANHIRHYQDIQKLPHISMYLIYGCNFTDLVSLRFFYSLRLFAILDAVVFLMAIDALDIL